MRIPLSTYRLQMSWQFTLKDLIGLIDYFHSLGVDTLYLSPLQAAAAGSLSGYDVVDHSRINPEIGTEDQLEHLALLCTKRNMALLLDIVPGHMNITDKNNLLWQDLLQKGEQSPFASYFEIDWHSGPSDLEGKILQPFLGESLFEAIKSGSLILNEEEGNNVFEYGALQFPCDPSKPVSLENQHYRLDHWKRGCSDCNYRRFFNISELACIRVEKPEVFQRVHALIIDWIEKEWIQGLRIDHVDGLENPAAYLRNLQEWTGGIYTVVEKILQEGEKLPSDWEAQGTTGYDFLNLVQGLFVFDDLEEIWRKFTGIEKPLNEIIQESKWRKLSTGMLSEWKGLAKQVPAELHSDLMNFLTTLPIYRTYCKGELTGQDNLLSQSLLNWINENPKFILKLQQLTPAVMAKGFEDTALYRFLPLTCLNEVGSNLARVKVDEFHQAMIKRQKEFPYSFSATSTHDTKRSEDTRCRIAILSQMPSTWKKALEIFSYLTHFPDRNLEYLFYQTLVGTWPIEPMKRSEHQSYSERIVKYMLKAAKEQNTKTSWIEPDLEFESALQKAVEEALSLQGAFFHTFDTWVKPLILPGLNMALATLAIKLCAPGVPDIYQGCETWNFSLVDPDNRTKVDFHNIDPMDEKYTLTKTLLHYRNKHPDLFLKGSYTPIDAGENALAFSREWKEEKIIVCIPLFFPKIETLKLAVNEHYEDLLTGKRYTGSIELFDELPFAILQKIENPLL